MRHMTISRMAFLGLLPLVLVACGNPTKKDLADMEARLQTNIAKSVADLERKVNGVDAKYASMLALEQQVKNGLQRIEQNAKLLETANETDAKMLQAHRNSLKEELRTIEDQLSVLQKVAAK